MHFYSNHANVFSFYLCLLYPHCIDRGDCVWYTLQINRYSGMYKHACIWLCVCACVSQTSFKLYMDTCDCMGMVNIGACVKYALCLSFTLICVYAVIHAKFSTTKISHSKNSSVFLFWTIVYFITSLQVHLDIDSVFCLGRQKVYLWFKQLTYSLVVGSEYIQSSYYHCRWLSGKKALQTNSCYMDLFVWWVKWGCIVR